MKATGRFPKIHRVYKSNSFTQLPNAMLFDRRLSSKAKGILAIMLSFPGDNTPTRGELEHKVKERSDAIRSAFRELRECGYARYCLERDENGRFTSGYEVFEDCALNPTASLCDERSTSKSVTLGADSPHTDNRHTVEFKWGYGIEEWVQRLESRGCKPKQVSGGGYTAHCPCHQDRKKSLSIRPGTKRKVLVKCHAGCSFDSVRHYLFPEESTSNGVYTYTDEHDSPLFRIIRDVKKRFMVQTQINGLWLRGLERQVRRVPYRLPELLKSIDQDWPVWIVEGEKDVEIMRGKGATATCNPFGAGKWRPDLNRWFRGAKVTIVADKDEAGYAHALTIEEVLRPIVQSVRIVVAAGGDEVNDATDHFRAGYGINDFVPVSREELTARRAA